MAIHKDRYALIGLIQQAVPAGGDHESENAASP
jgi:hypothetical protein